MKGRSLAVLILAGALFRGELRAEDVRVETAPPVVIRTVPAPGTSQVDPAVTEIQVTFSKEMADESWSWVELSPTSFPELAGKPRYRDDRRTCVLPVRLRPGTTYALWINTNTHRNFKDREGRSALPYLLVFQTR